VVVLLAALSAGWFGRGVVSGDGAGPEPSGQPGPSTMQKLAIPPLCERDGITCLGNRTYRFALRAPVQWHIPRQAGVASSLVLPVLVESYWPHNGSTAGVTVGETVRPSSPTGQPARGFGASPSPRAFAEWIHSRSDLAASRPVATTLEGRPAWRVRARLARNAGPATLACNGQFECHPMTYSAGGRVMGIWDDMVADYTFVRIPGGGTTVVWSWAFGYDTAALARNQALVDGISWPTS
jgi:hypothetical protein